MSRLPNFFIVGAPKAGTTSLYHYLDQHPQVYLSSIKEPHFFADEIREANCDLAARRIIARENRGVREFVSGPMREKRFGGIVPDWESYTRLFANAANQSALGEASVCYLWSRSAPQRIVEKIPDAKILALLRDPVERAFSQYIHGLSNGAIQWSFREHIQRNLGHNSEQISVHYPFLEFGLYSEQLQRYLDRFGPNVWIGFYDDFKSQPQDLLRSVFQFLGVDPEFEPDTTHRYLEAQVPRLPAIGRLKTLGLWQAAASVTPSKLRPAIRRALTHKQGTIHIDPADRRFLIDFYGEDIARLATLLNRNLDGWLK